MARSATITSGLSATAGFEQRAPVSDRTNYVVRRLEQTSPGLEQPNVVVGQKHPRSYA
jgi:hypothetical protein